jgi:hypothetical protein
MILPGGKPGWNDALNGLPGLLGSGMPETYEMLKLIRFIVDSLSRHGEGMMDATNSEQHDVKIEFPVEFSDFMVSLSDLLDDILRSDGNNGEDADLKAFAYWGKVNSLREEYRRRVEVYFSGNEVSWTSHEVREFLSKLVIKSELGISKAKEFGIVDASNSIGGMPSL